MSKQDLNSQVSLAMARQLFKFPFMGDNAAYRAI